MTRKELIEIVARKTGQSEKSCGEVIRETFDVITNELAGHGCVIIPKFGTFYVGEKKSRAYVNPNNIKETTLISTRKYPRLRTAPALKAVVK